MNKKNEVRSSALSHNLSFEMRAQQQGQQFLLFLAACVTVSYVAADSPLTFIDFSNGESGTSWVAENDPVMGGVSNGNITIESDRLAWDGDVKIVPELEAPGFCLTYTTGLNHFPNASAFSALTLKVRSIIPYTGFKVSFSTALHPSTQFEMFKADFPSSFPSGSGSWEDVTIPFTNFTYSWSSYTGEPIHTCAEDNKYCPTPKDLETIRAFDVWAEGVEGLFHLDVQEIGAI